MQFEEELFFRQIAKESEFLTEEQLEECLEIRRRNPKATSLFVLLIEKGYLHHTNMPAIIGKLPPELQKGAAALISKSKQKFGEICIEKGFVTAVQIQECLNIQNKLKQEGKHFRLGQILIEKKYLAVRQAQSILKFQGKKILRCVKCETKYNIRNYKTNKKYQCPKCGGELLSFKPSSVSMGVEKSFATRDSVDVDDESLALINTQVGGYKITQLLGEGGMATVYQAVASAGKRPKALKIMKSQAGIERFNLEFERAFALRHPNIVRVYERGKLDTRPYFFMEYLDGGTLSKRIEKMGVIPLLEGISILKQVAMGLKYAHENSIVHRDVKPSNIMLTRDSHNRIIAKITDFGIARTTDSQITVTGQLVGTFKYMAPEYIKGMSIDGKNDIFSLGIVAYEMFTGREPFTVDAPVGYLFVNIKETPPPLNQINPDIPKYLALIANQMMAKDVNKRYDAAGFLRDLDLFAEHLKTKKPIVTEDKNSVFYARNTLNTLKEFWGKITQKFGAMEPTEIEGQKKIR